MQILDRIIYNDINIDLNFNDFTDINLVFYSHIFDINPCTYS